MANALAQGLRGAAGAGIGAGTGCDAAAAGRTGIGALAAIFCARASSSPWSTFNTSATITGQSDLRIELAGHTDDRGSENYNKVLSTQRAEAVRQYLISKGVSSERLVAVGYGETKPVLPNDTDEGREANRRVELKALLK